MVLRVVLCASVAAACGGLVTSGSSDGACPQTQSDAGACDIAKYSVVCPSRACLTDTTDDPTCPLDGDAGCVDQCASDEYAAWCGGPPPAKNDPPSSQCRSITMIPSGTIIYCCRCGS